MKVFIAQTNPTVGDLVGNLSLIQQSVLQAVSVDCDVIVFSELVTTGYPPRDLLYSPEFWKDHQRVIDKLASFVRQLSRQVTVIVGGLHEVMLSGGRYARYNAAWILDRHFGRRVVHKRLLPCYDVFDETRYFHSGINEPYSPIPLHIAKTFGRKIEYDVFCDVLICEDIWNNKYCGGAESMKPATYTADPLDDIERYGRGPLFVLNASPFWVGKIEETQKLVESVCERLRQPVIWCNQIGSHDDIITGGYSIVSIPSEGLCRIHTRRAKAFQEDQIVIRLNDPHTLHSNLNEDRDIEAVLVPLPTLSSFNRDALGNSPQIVDAADFEMWTIYKALFLHMSDYRRRCGFKKAVLGLSGGIDSAVVAVMAAHVFGAENVTGIGMPSPHSSKGSVSDAEVLAMSLNIRFELMRITQVYNDVKDLFLSGGKQEFDHPVTDENIQPRVRALLLMAYSNEHDPCLLLTTGNKSEITVGYFTVGGDSLGGLAVISDLWKTQVYQLANFMNKYFGEPIPQSTIDKPPSAELRPGQEDTDSLPPYDVLDPMLKMFVEEDKSIIEVKLAFPDVDVVKVFRMHINSEFKRGQLCIGPKLSGRAYGAGRRMPVACKRTLELFPWHCFGLVPIDP